MPFLYEPEPPRGVAETIVPGIRRIVAGNATPTTYHGTNTYLIGEGDDVTVLDPGPDREDHVQHILDATGGRVRNILLSHAHRDHFGAAPALRAATGAPIHAFHESAEPDFTPDVPLRDGDPVLGMVAIHTPGHAPDHLCFAAGNGILFSADHVMSWSSTVVSPPKGNMTEYCNSLRLMLARPETLFLPGHGPKLPNPKPFVQDLLNNRQRRERAIAGILTDEPLSTGIIMNALYSKVDPVLRRAAERNVISHLIKLEAEGLAIREGELWRRAQPVAADAINQDNL
ncbi:MBL fold metallo-hydrolase [Agaricicola taiwanensis]|uniref:MBL fold metallo-hydrolase n=1 Tax=Agaricicola taiwanensis TaxID=591372 RepID=A0A8J2YLH5_9RHOB|nr:MBL fold metallo-hydrolase [Agaricicola taiwanensis]GGE50162.1 MBL fold metallo-hydrolase [Agaricicola taiwanensis]